MRRFHARLGLACGPCSGFLAAGFGGFFRYGHGARGRFRAAVRGGARVASNVVPGVCGSVTVQVVPPAAAVGCTAASVVHTTLSAPLLAVRVSLPPPASVAGAVSASAGLYGERGGSPRRLRHLCRHVDGARIIARRKARFGLHGERLSPAASVARPFAKPLPA